MLTPAEIAERITEYVAIASNAAPGSAEERKALDDLAYLENLVRRQIHAVNRDTRYRRRMKNL